MPPAMFSPKFTLLLMGHGPSMYGWSRARDLPKAVESKLFRSPAACGDVGTKKIDIR
jgi:hypothetical protein